MDAIEIKEPCNEEDFVMPTATPWERAAYIVGLLIVIGVIISFASFAFLDRTYEHQEKMQQICLDRGLIWYQGECRFR